MTTRTIAPSGSADAPFIGMRTPWGKADSVTRLADGIWSVGTPSHGGIRLSRARQAAMPDYMRQPGRWYEEDCEWALVFVAFEADILFGGDTYALKNINDGRHKKTLCNWFPDEFERFFGVEIEPGRSYIKERRRWRAENAGKLQAVSVTSGNSAYPVPEGMVRVTACIGGRTDHGQYAGPTSDWLVPADEYRAPLPAYASFIVDPQRHQRAD